MFAELKTRYVGRKSWPTITGSVSSVEYNRATGRDTVGTFRVDYTFWLEGHIYGGAYTENEDGPQTPYYLKTDDPIDICYNPVDPNLNFNPVVDFVYQHGLKAIAIGACLTIAAVLLFFIYVL